jgi:hypothetical protein
MVSPTLRATSRADGEAALLRRVGNQEVTR